MAGYWDALVRALGGGPAGQPPVPTGANDPMAFLFGAAGAPPAASAAGAGNGQQPMRDETPPGVETSIGNMSVTPDPLNAFTLKLGGPGSTPAFAEPTVGGGQLDPLGSLASLISGKHSPSAPGAPGFGGPSGPLTSDQLMRRALANQEGVTSLAEEGIRKRTAAQDAQNQFMAQGVIDVAQKANQDASDLLKQRETLTANVQQRLQGISADIDKISKQNTDSNRWFKQQGTGANVLMGIGLALQGFNTGKFDPHAFIMKQIEMDVESQGRERQAAIEGARAKGTLAQQELQAGESLFEFKAKRLIEARERAMDILKAEAVKMGTPIAEANAQLEIAKLHDANTKTFEELAKTVSAQENAKISAGAQLGAAQMHLQGVREGLINQKDIAKEHNATQLLLEQMKLGGGAGKGALFNPLTNAPVYERDEKGRVVVDKATGQPVPLAALDPAEGKQMRLALQIGSSLNKEIHDYVLLQKAMQKQYGGQTAGEIQKRVLGAGYENLGATPEWQDLEAIRGRILQKFGALTHMDIGRVSESEFKRLELSGVGQGPWSAFSNDPTRLMLGGLAKINGELNDKLTAGTGKRTREFDPELRDLHKELEAKQPVDMSRPWGDVLLPENESGSVVPSAIGYAAVPPLAITALGIRALKKLFE
jgi:hypothetical protein